MLSWCAFSYIACVNTGKAGADRGSIKTLMQYDTALHQQGGFLLYNGERFTGLILNVSGTDTLYQCCYEAGKQEGKEVLKYPSGQLSEERFYKAGRKTGVHTGWYENGNPRFEYHLKDDVYEGPVKEWLPGGLLVKEFNYVNGHEEGRQRMWYEDGRILANYDVRNGRKYGLTGVKNCVSVKEDLNGK